MSQGLIYSIGFLAQLLFSARLFVQWFLSERQKRVVTPSLFWQLSLLASFLFFVYGYLPQDFAKMLGQSEAKVQNGMQPAQHTSPAATPSTDKQSMKERGGES